MLRWPIFAGPVTYMLIYVSKLTLVVHFSDCTWLYITKNHYSIKLINIEFVVRLIFVFCLSSMKIKIENFVLDAIIKSTDSTLLDSPNHNCYLNHEHNKQCKTYLLHALEPHKLI